MLSKESMDCSVIWKTAAQRLFPLNCSKDKQGSGINHYLQTRSVGP